MIDRETMFSFLDDLREVGACNMFAAAPYLEAEFDLDRRDAKAVLLDWMQTFDERHPAQGAQA